MNSPEARVGALSPREFYRRWESIPSETEKREALRLRYRHHLPEFARHCFPEVAYLPFNAFHREILERPKHDWRSGRPTLRRAYAAPRGIAKSTLTKIDVAHDIAYALERVIVVLSATIPDAWTWSRAVRSWFSDPESAISQLYGPFTVRGGDGEFHVTGPLGEVTVASRGFRSDIRGYNVQTIRPTRVIVDDGESRKHVGNPEIREQWQRFLNEDLLKLGRKEGGTLYDWLGTVLHPDAILARILARRAPNQGWSAQKYRALLRWPDRADLWEQARALWADLEYSADAQAREDRARAFYEDHRAEMDAGAEVLDPYGLPLWRIYTIIWAEGLAAALKELNNDPSDPSTRIFQPDTFRRCRYDPGIGQITSAAGKTLHLSACEVGVWLDPIPAERTGSDYAALAVVARERATGRRYALECGLWRISAAQQRAKVWTAFERYGPRAVYGYEDNGFQALLGESFRREQEERQRAGRPFHLAVQGHTSSENKLSRIARLQPDCENGWLEFADDLPAEVLEQFRDLPGATHDDGPDAIERADWLIGQALPTVSRAAWSTR